jgi:L-threonylcarbamoyladenylate synthase
MNTWRKESEVKKAALFLDRDGTINEDLGNLGSPSSLLIIPGVIPALKRMSRLYELFVVSNQVGVARGAITREQVEEVNGALNRILEDEGIHIREWYVCPHEESDRCGCRKPSPHFLRKAAEDYSIDLGSSFMVGDHPTDPQTAEAAGAFGLYVLTGHGTRHLDELPESVPVFHNLAEACEWIEAHPHPRQYFEEITDSGAEALKRGELTVFPTETVYGIGADARNPEAVARIFEAKQRPLYDPLIVHVSDAVQVERLVPELPEKARSLMEEFWPGPLTLVLPKDESVPDIVTAGKGSVAVRMPSHPLALRLIAKAGLPVAAPSANLFGRTSPTTAAHVLNQLEGSFEVLIDGGTCRVGVESTVLSLLEDPPRLLRAGGLAPEEIESLIGPISYPEGSSGTAESGEENGGAVAAGADSANESASAGTGEESPGLLPDHYAPVTPLRMVDSIEEYRRNERVAKLLFSGSCEGCRGPWTVLSPRGEVREAAVRLYHAMQELDSSGVELIVAERAPDRGLGHAINDRLQKASEK